MLLGAVIQKEAIRMAKTETKKAEDTKVDPVDRKALDHDRAKLGELQRAMEEAKAAAEEANASDDAKKAYQDAYQEWDDLNASVAERDVLADKEDNDAAAAAQKDAKDEAGPRQRSNVPDNPNHVEGSEDQPKVRLQMFVSDGGGTWKYIDVPRNMVGDYMRAGWNLPDGVKLPPNSSI